MTKAVAAKPRKAGRALIEIAEAEGITITYENVYPGSVFIEKILKARHKPLYSAEFPKSKKPSILEPFSNVDDVYLKRATKGSLEYDALQSIKESESAEQEKARECAPITDRSYVERSDFTVQDLYNDIVSLMEWNSIATYLMRLLIFGNSALTTYTDCLDWDYYRVERKKFRNCRYRYCLNMFPIEGDNIRGDDAKRSDSRYCCEICRKSAFDSEERFKKHGSYLPVYYYVEQTSEYIGDEARLREVAKSIDVIDSRSVKGNATSPIKGNRRRKSLEQHEFKPFLTVNIATGKVEYASENPLMLYRGH
ncbi:hypothetical protein ABIA69_002728 [Lysinibacillus parviboronicapiens]|uniref:Uncharacterized protein n=1 Tax=Lysinibacillus parviboronicapiens TaxID=436516 RepID=A0ABV2PKU8_9BACI